MFIGRHFVKFDGQRSRENSVKLQYKTGHQQQKKKKKERKRKAVC